MTSCSGATISEDPTAVIASDESRTATFHFAECRTWTDETTRIGWMISWVWRSSDDRQDGNEGDEDGTHFYDRNFTLED